MAIEIEIDPVEEKKEGAGSISFKLNARRSIDGNIMIFDHIDIDIVYMPSKNKIVTFAKEQHNDSVYAAQNRLFEHLRRKGVITPETVRGGNVYGSMEALVPNPVGGLNETNIIMLSLSKFLEEEKPYFMYEKKLDDEETERVTDPDAEDSTELGEVPHAAKKGSIGRMRGYWNV
jgi:hypothetical protein